MRCYTITLEAMFVAPNNATKDELEELAEEAFQGEIENWDGILHNHKLGLSMKLAKGWDERGLVWGSKDDSLTAKKALKLNRRKK